MSGYYPAGLTDWSPDAPWNQDSPEARDFDVTVSQTLSKNTSVLTNNYNEYEVYLDPGYGMEMDTSEVNWHEEYENDHNTPLQLIELFKEECQNNLKKLEGTDPNASGNPQFIIQEKRRLMYLISECEGWTEDEFEVVEG